MTVYLINKPARSEVSIHKVYENTQANKPAEVILLTDVCAGEEDQDAYDISRLQKTDMDPLGATFVPRRDRPLRSECRSFRHRDRWGWEGSGRVVGVAGWLSW